MCLKLLLILFFSGCFLLFADCSIVEYPKLDPIPVIVMANWTTEPTSTVQPENETVIEPVQCQTNEDCQVDPFDIPGFIFICNKSLKLCVLAQIEVPKGDTATPATPKDTTSSVSKKAPSSTTPQPEIAKLDNSLSSVPHIVWVLMVVPFVSIIILGIICGRRLKAQSLNIQENLMRTTINGVHVDQLLTQRELLNSLAAISRPPPTYEKVTGEIPPSYETFLQALQEKRQSIFNCNSLMTEPDDKEDTASESIGGGSLRSVSHNRAANRNTPIFAISHTNIP